MRNPQPTPIRQEDIVELAILRDGLRNMRRAYESKRGEILQAILKGASVEEGPHTIETGIRCILAYR